MKRKQCGSLFAFLLLAATLHAQDDGPFVIRGRVVDAMAKPVPGAAVRLFAASFNGFDVDEKTASDAEGRFSVLAPKKWVIMDTTYRQELALLAMKGDRIGIVQFSRNSTPPKSEVELVLANSAETKVEILSPDLRPVVGAKVKIAGLRSDVIRVDPTEAELRLYAKNARKTPVGYAISTDTVGLPPDLQMEVGATDAKGMATIVNIGADRIGAITVQTTEFGEQTVGHYSLGTKAPNWLARIVLKKTGRVTGQLSSPLAGAIARREITLTTFEQDGRSGAFFSSSTKVVTDPEGKFDVPAMVPGAVRFAVKFDPAQPLYPEQSTGVIQLKAGETLQLKVPLKPAVRVEGRVLDAESKKPIKDIQVRAFVGMGFESTISDAAGKISFWMPAGETALHPDIPNEFLPLIRPSDHLDPDKRQRAMTIFKVLEGKTFQAPPILLHRRATLRGVILDDQGKPLTGAAVSALSMSLDRMTSQPKSVEANTKANEWGEFTFAGIDPREPIRLRVTAKTGSKILTIAKPGREELRVLIAPNEQFVLSGRVADAEGKPLANAVLELWHRDWRPEPTQAEPKKLSHKEPIRSDAEGRFKTPALLADGYYRFTIRAAGAKTTESDWLDATNPETAKPLQLVATRLGGSSGVARDRAGKPIVDARVSLFAQETRMETTTNARGEFKLETPVGKPFCVVVRHPEFRVHGTYFEKNPTNLDLAMVRLSEPGEKLSPRMILPKMDREKMLTRLLEPIKQKLLKSTNDQEKVQTLQSLTGPAPEFVMEFLEKNPLSSAMYNEMLIAQVAMKGAPRDPEEAEEQIGRMKPGAQKSMAYGMLVDALPEKARAKKLEILAEALVAAKAEKSPEFRAIALGQVAKRLFVLGEKERATAILREGQKIANGLSTSSFAGYARGSFATDLALIDLPAALALMKDLKDRQEFPRHHGNTAHRIAATQPAEAVRVLDMIPPPGPNEFNQRDYYAVRVCYRMAQADLKRALQLANSVVDVPSRAYALGVIAQGVAKSDPKQAAELLRRAFALLEEDAARPDPPQLTSALTQGSAAAALILIAENVDPTLVRECLWRGVALQRPATENPDHVWRYATGNNALAMVAARYDAKLAASLLPIGKAVIVTRESQLANYLVDPQRAIEAAEKAPNQKEDRSQLQLINYLATRDDHTPRLILNTLGIWRIDVEDFDF